MMTKHYRFGHTEIEINMPEDMPVPENMSLFKIGDEGDSRPAAEAGPGAGSGSGNGSEPQSSSRPAGGFGLRDDSGPRNGSRPAAEAGPGNSTKYHLSFTDDIQKDMHAALSRKAGNSVIEKPKIIIFPIDENRGECRFIRFEGAPLPYAVAVESPMGHFQVVCDRQFAELLQYDTMFNSMLALERVVLRDDAIILHSSYLEIDEGMLGGGGSKSGAGSSHALLFSGPSGIGKSTQAALWDKYRSARILNGDKSLLIREPDGWYAYGWPICGSSEICLNETRPIKAIVMLRQAERNICRRMDPFRAVMEVMGQITTNTWDREFRMKVISLTEQLIREVPVYELFCEVSEGAVKCLEEVLRDRIDGDA